MARKYRDWITEYMRYSSLSEAPDKFHFWTAVSVVAGALRRRVWIDQGYFQWTPNFYIIFVAPPGIVSKSTTANIGMRLLKELPDIRFGPDAVTWQALTQALAGATEEVMMPDGNFHPMSCLTIVSSEFGTFMNPNDRDMVDVLVSLWDGQIGVWEKATKTQGSDRIINPWINIVACTTPSWIAGNFPEYMIGGGFTSRCVFVYAEEKRRLQAYPGRHLPPDFYELADNLITDLEHISMLKGEYKLSEEAERWGEQWYAEHYAARNKTVLGAHPMYSGYWARKQTHMHKLAIILAASQRDEPVVERVDLERANGLLNEIETDMPKVFSLIGRSEDARNIDIITSFLQQNGGAVYRDHLIREASKVLGIRQIDEAMKALVEARIVLLKQVGNKIIVCDNSAIVHSEEPFSREPN